MCYEIHWLVSSFNVYGDYADDYTDLLIAREVFKNKEDKK
jgi:hypothetical protein